MGISERKEREKAAREQRIIGAARMLAEKDGWVSVTVRRLAQEIEYSQPVLYAHFESRDAIVGAVALDGFGELGPALRASVRRGASPAEAMEDVAIAYLEFAFERPALYEAMFILPSGLRFAKSDTPQVLRDTFGAMMAVVEPFCADAEVATEAFWATLHGLAELERHGRIRAAFRKERAKHIVGMFSRGS
ncbi:MULTISPECIES: TetR/AcrR family transcriptional regulator [unclassified Rhizobium]|uniref:TetR/AcrR family transcriptional regulator n=1 Tax=unclassified Rhizobium TaxID=2613769 RepID=UPI001C830D8D|nr:MULTISPECIES: TetR/AcrR family transcriptional regulator [unclassified Rhizobium]MBX5165443.1 TetR/AcrR family transcriptional regulator [Rhizobium sp. NZLR4b]MBX5170331.1 TetR/AcrR family transcriptional regulator [Rhizobium sp. NZLR1b]MBX5211951.1 TetR/AcrR family transcriptional regulator [Rhizobium sp. NZLR11]